MSTTLSDGGALDSDCAISVPGQHRIDAAVSPDSEFQEIYGV